MNFGLLALRSVVAFFVGLVSADASVGARSQVGSLSRLLWRVVCLEVKVLVVFIFIFID